MIDALNVAYWCGHPATLRLPLALLTHLREANVPATAVFDASARYRLADQTDIYQQLIQCEDCVEVPAGRTADGVMLRYATSFGATIISRDRFRDYRRRYRKLIDDPTRRVSGQVAHSRLMVPALDIDVPLEGSVERAWQRLLTERALGDAGAATEQ